MKIFTSILEPKLVYSVLLGKLKKEDLQSRTFYIIRHSKPIVSISFLDASQDIYLPSGLILAFSFSGFPNKTLRGIRGVCIYKSFIILSLFFISISFNISLIAPLTSSGFSYITTCPVSTISSLQLG